MLSRGFKDQIYDVFRKLPNETQVNLLSATMPPDVLEVTKRFMRDPIRILVKKEELTLEGIKQFYVQVEKEVSCLHVSIYWMKTIVVSQRRYNIRAPCVIIFTFYATLPCTLNMILITWKAHRCRTSSGGLLYKLLLCESNI